jgi:hypothetical protein
MNSAQSSKKRKLNVFRNSLRFASMTGQGYNVRYESGNFRPAGGEELSIFITQSSFAYAIFSNGYKSLEALCHVEHSSASDPPEEKLRMLIGNYRLGSMNFSKVQVALLNRNFTILPQVYASAGDIRPFLKFASGTAETGASARHNIGEAAFCYQGETAITTVIERTFSNASIRHAGAVTCALHNSQHSLVKKDIFLNIHEGTIEIGARKGSSFLFYNIFQCSSDEDILYYLLFTMEQLDLDPLSAQLVIAGERAANDELIRNISKYARNVSLAVGDPSIKRAGSLAALPAHYYFTLLHQHQCEL